MISNLAQKADEWVTDPRLKHCILQSITHLPLLHAVELKSAFIQLMTQNGVLTPRQIISPGLDEALHFASITGYPVLAKRDFSWAGFHVKLLEDKHELAQSIGSNKSNTSFSIQELISGKPAAVSLSARTGRASAMFSFFKERTNPGAFGPTSVAKIVRIESALASAEIIVGLLNYTGFAGIDFIITAEGTAYAIEFNGRVTPTSHLGNLVDADLCKGFYSAFNKPTPCLQMTSHEVTVALFPNEIMRDRNSHFLTLGIHDIPWEDKSLLIRMLALYN